MRLIISIIFRNVAADQQQPPAKRRRGLAGSIVSTAVSAALIGTAVGLTVYRLWRDRGKDAEPPLITVGTEAGPNTSSSPPPPPYSSSDPQAPPSLNVVPPTPRSTPRKTRQHQAHSSARKRPRRVPHLSLHNINSFGPAAFDFTSPHRRNIPTTPSDDEAETADDQMDWIGSKLTSLIEEGRKALGREVVVMSESKEDEVDDGSGEWVEEEGVDEFGTRIGGRPRGRSNAGSGSRSGSRRTPGSANASLGRRAGAAAAAGVTINAPSSVNFTGSSTSYSASTSPRESQFDLNAGLSSSLPNTLHGMGPGSSVRHDSESSWQSPELRETMERARAQARERRTNLGTASSSPTSFSFS
ncbi:hypothetical protein D9757_009073 [Collybiopsis confluens]|uniref:Uncharacterized protein n=1 Tax=Collybiopsis confluens TaxID=2823264 RepID=A0A8H5M5G8_9AGAR|nr:hypothetical protein D9757_009073 [Collybiopsis confluens]